jgi:hypothetical protein
LLTELTCANRDQVVIVQVRSLMKQSARAEQVLAENDATLEEKDFPRKKISGQFKGGCKGYNDCPVCPGDAVPQ